jgi:WD40 repeat protein
MNKIFYWLNLSEYLLVILSLITLLISLNSGNMTITILLVIITILLNLINRLYSEKRHKSKLNSAFKKLNQRIDKIEAIFDKKEIFVPPTPLNNKISSSTINSYQEYLVGMEKSLNNLIQYLNNSAFGTRIENLENLITDLNNKINTFIINEYSNSETQIKLSKTQRHQVKNMKNPPPVQKWHRLKTLSEHSASVTSLALTPDGKFLASGSSDKSLKIWSLKDNLLLDSVPAHEQGLLCLDFTNSNNGNYYLATGSYDQTIRLWTVDQNKNKAISLKASRSLTNHTGSIYSLILDPQSNILVSGSYDQTVKQWDLLTGKLISSSFDPLGAVYTIAIHEKKGIVASAGADGSISLWKLKSGEMLGFLSGNVSSVQSLAISPDGQILAAGCVDGNIRLWRLSKDILDSKIEPLPFQVIKAHSAGHVTCLIFTHDNQNLFSSGVDGKIKIWDLLTFVNVGILTINEHNDRNHNRILAIALSQDGTLLTVGSIDGKITLWSREK